MLLRLKPFTNSHFHFVTVVSVSSQVLLQRPKHGSLTGQAQDYETLASDWLTLSPFVACFPSNVLPPNKKKQNAGLTQKLQAKEPYLLNMPHILKLGHDHLLSHPCLIHYHVTISYLILLIIALDTLSCNNWTMKHPLIHADTHLRSKVTVLNLQKCFIF
jgi:hypothetical protein